jgi:hypothetical protein
MADNKDNADTTAKAGNGGYSDGLVKLVEETDKDGAISYCVECAKTGDLLYSSNSKPQAYSFCEGYRARDANDDKHSTKGKAKDDKTKDDSGNAGNSTPQAVDPTPVKRKRMVF